VFKGKKMKTMLLHNTTVHSCLSFSKPSMTSWYNSSKPIMPTLMEFEKEVQSRLPLALHALYLSHQLLDVASGAWGRY
jgi:hypothetical protein